MNMYLSVTKHAYVIEDNSVPKYVSSRPFKLAKEAFEFDFESKEEFTFCASPPFNTLSTKKLKEIVLKAKTTFKWQSSKEGQFRREDPFNDWMFTRPLALRPIYWEISSDA